MSALPGLLHLSGGVDARVAVTNNTQFAMLALIFIVLSVGFASMWFLQVEAGETIEIPTPPIKEAAKAKKKGAKAVKTSVTKKPNSDVATRDLADEERKAPRDEDSAESKVEIEEEEWIDIPINRGPSTHVEKKSVAFAAQIVDLTPPMAMAPPRDKAKKKDKETLEQKQARLERKAATKRQRELEEAEQRRAFEERLKASEMAAILQAQEDAEKGERRNSPPNSARSDGSDWVIRSKKGENRRVKTFEELLEERKAKQAAQTVKNTQVGEGTTRRPRTNPPNSSNTSDRTDGSKLNKSGRVKKDKKMETEKEAKKEAKKEAGKEIGVGVGEGEGALAEETEVDTRPDIRGKGEKTHRKPRNDKRENDKNKIKDNGASNFADISTNLAAAGFDSEAVGSSGSVSLGRFDDNQQAQRSPPGLSRSREKEAGQLYDVPSPTRDTNVGSLATWRTSGMRNGLPDLPPLPLPLPSMSDADAVYASNSGGSGGRVILQRPGSGPNSKEPTPRHEEGVKQGPEVQQKQPQVLNLADLERNLFDITK